MFALVGCASPPRQTHDQNHYLNTTVVDVNGVAVQPFADRARIATVLIFITRDCPISNSYAPQINTIVDQYSTRSIAFYLVHVDGDVSSAAARSHALDFGFHCPVLLDRHHDLVNLAGARVTPEAAVFDDAGNLAYRGRIDDRYMDFGKKRLEPTQRDLCDAVDALLSGRPVINSRTKAVGCPIPEL